ncbi:MAG: hypothetical protein OXU20_03540 [Myxococcales bacterium]|nr:hypothetical protein [Myxococcales bacterium]
MTGSQRGTNVYTYRPGATINISVRETISHPGYFRIAFDADGDDDFPVPEGTSGEFGDCMGDPACGEGKEDYCSNETVLLDNLDPHASAGFLTQETYTWSVTLPNIECDNCTLQIIQMMNDFNFHPRPYPADDIYYHCIDLVLSNDAPETNDTPVENNGMVCPGMAEPEMPAEMDPEMMSPEMNPEMPAETDPEMMSPEMNPEMPAETAAPEMPADMRPPAMMAPESPTMDPVTPAQMPAATGAQPVDVGDMGSMAGAGGTETPSTGTVTSAVQAPPATEGGDDGGGCRIASAPSASAWLPIVASLLSILWRRRQTHR